MFSCETQPTHAQNGIESLRLDVGFMNAEFIFHYIPLKYDLLLIIPFGKSNNWKKLCYNSIPKEELIELHIHMVTLLHKRLVYHLQTFLFSL